MRNTIYVCSFKKNDLLNESFDFREEAINWAKEHIAAEPIVEAVDLEYSEEFGAEPEIYEREEIFRYPEEISDEKEKISKDEEDSILAELEKYADKIDAEGDKLHRDHPELESLKESSIESEIESVAANWGDVQESLKEEADPIEEDVILFDPFGCDFSECEPMEVCKDEHRADCCDNICASPADFLREFAAELGIADEVEISEKECADDSCEEKHEDEIPCDNCENEISEISDKAKDPEDVVPEEVKANEEPNVEVQVEDEKPAEEISKCHVCPECGKEICESADNNIAYVPEEPEPVTDKEKCSADIHKELVDYCNKNHCEPHDIPLEVEKEIIQKNIKKYNIQPDFKTATKEAAGSESKKYTLDEAARIPDIDVAEAQHAAQVVANAEGKDVIYGYFGPDPRGGKKYFEIDHIVCKDAADLRAQTAKVKKKYGADENSSMITVLVAYPEINETKNCELEDKMLFMEEQEEMSDLELAKAVFEAHNKKHLLN